jgi:hypothetical protein
MVEPEVARASKALWASAASLERKALIDVNAHLSRSHHLEQLVRGSFKRIALSSSEPRERPSAEFESHEAYRFPQKDVPLDILMQVQNSTTSLLSRL